MLCWSSPKGSGGAGAWCCRLTAHFSFPPGLPISTYAKYCYRKLQKVAVTGGKKVSCCSGARARRLPVRHFASQGPEGLVPALPEVSAHSAKGSGGRAGGGGVLRAPLLVNVWEQAAAPAGCCPGAAILPTAEPAAPAAAQLGAPWPSGRGGQT